MEVMSIDCPRTTPMTDDLSNSEFIGPIGEEAEPILDLADLSAVNDVLQELLTQNVSRKRVEEAAAIIKEAYLAQSRIEDQ
jgi:hypothetical protein